MWKWLGITNEAKENTEGSENKNDEAVEKENENEKLSEIDQPSSNKDAKENLKHVAANVSNYLYSFADVASKTASKLKETVDVNLDKTIIGDFQRENEKFVQDNEARRIGDAVPPWTGYHEEETMKRQILALSADERNFLRDPPSGVDFQFNIEHSMPVAMAVLQEDTDLKQMRFSLVPKRVKEERFWRNYFYRVSLIKQSTQLSSLADQELKKSPYTSSSESINTPRGSDKTDVKTVKEMSADDLDVAGSPPAHEFVSDAFQHNEGLSEEEKHQMLGLNKKENEEKTNEISDNWEQEIAEELESFELVNDEDGKKDDDDVENDDDNNWEQEIEDMLGLDEEEDSKT